MRCRKAGRVMTFIFSLIVPEAWPGRNGPDRRCALYAFAHAAAQNDRAWITFFESNYRDFAEKPLERDALLRDPKFQSIAALGTGGGTELLPALQHIMTVERQFSTQRQISMPVR